MKLCDINKQFVCRFETMLFQSCDDSVFINFDENKINLPEAVLKESAKMITDKVNKKDYEKYGKFDVLYSGVSNEYKTLIVISQK